MRARELLDATWQVVAATPGEGVVQEYATALIFPLRIYARTRSLFRASALLIQSQFPEEAMILGRSLFEESLWLGAFAAASGKGRDALILGWAYGSHGDELRLMRSHEAAKATGVEDEVIAALEKELSKLQALQRRLEITKTVRMRDVKSLATEQGRLDDYWDFLYAHRVTHGQVTVHRGRTRRLRDPDTYGIYLQTGDPGMMSAAIGFTVRAMLYAHRSACTLFSWPEAPRVGELLAETDDLAGRLSAGESD